MSVFLETPRLRLRDWLPSDQNAFARMNADGRVMEYFLHPLSEEQSRDMLQRIREEIAREGFGLWAVERKEDGKWLGFTGFHRVGFEAPFTPAVEIAWRLCHEAWGRGYAPEAAAACLEYGKEILGLTEICAFTTLENQRSQRVMQKIGMKMAGEFDHPQVSRTHPLLRHVLYTAMLSSDTNRNE